MNSTDKKNSCCGSGVIAGIRCDVRNCVYHEGDSCCTAGCVTVGPKSAKSSSETLCATFKEKKTCGNGACDI